MLYIEAPVGVGFSYSTSGDYACDDDRTAAENMKAVNVFFGLFPEFRGNPFFITGESYAGVYVPTLAEAILQGQQDGTYSGAPLSGIAAGNGCSGTQVGICGDGPQVRATHTCTLALPAEVFGGVCRAPSTSGSICCRRPSWTRS